MLYLESEDNIHNELMPYYVFALMNILDGLLYFVSITETGQVPNQLVPHLLILYRNWMIWTVDRYNWVSLVTATVFWIEMFL